MRETKFENGECYHVYNRGVDKRTITRDKFDSDRFVQGLIDFNTSDDIGSIRDCELRRERGNVNPVDQNPLVEIIAYCLNPNHFHFILRQLQDNGISLFLRSQAGGYARYFNKRHHRTGALFEGRFKAKWIEDNEELRYKSVYVNLNDRVHRLGEGMVKLVRSSWNEYAQSVKGISRPEIVLSGFKNFDAYERYANDTLAEILEAKELEKELQQIEFED